MTHVYFDASALSKRYTSEPGAAVVNHVFGRVWPARVHVLAVGIGEAASVLRRRRNAGLLSANAYALGMSDLRTEVLDHPAVHQAEADINTVRASFDFIDRHNLNATDALVLRTALDLRLVLAPAGGDVLLVASDLRLLGAAGAEGLATFDPERQPAADFDARFVP